MSLVADITQTIDSLVFNESIQALIRDMKATQHGDRTNSFYDLLSDYHQEGGVWKHTLLAIQSLPAIAAELATMFNDQQFQELYDEFKNDLRVATLYHDIGKLSTQEPSKQRLGSFSFPEHGAKDIVKTVINKYGLTMNHRVRNLVTSHHASPAEFQALKAVGWSDADLKLLVMLKAVDSIATGPKGIVSAVAHVTPFVDLIS